MPGVVAACQLLRRQGYLLIMVTNQPDVARGKVAKIHVQQINMEIDGQLRLDGLYCCFHDNQDNCGCRKPKPGMLLQAARNHDIELEDSWMIGDREVDIQAGELAGCHTLWIGKDVASLLEAAAVIAAKNYVEEMRP